MKFAFVSVDSHGRALDTVQVRSHCMRGKNRREGSRRSRRALRQQQLEAQTDAQTPPSQVSPDTRAVANTNLRNRNQLPCPTVINPKFLPESVGKGSMELLTKYGRLKEAIYPIDICVDFEVIQDDYVGWFATEPAFVHSIFFMGSALQDLAMKRPLSQATLFHLKETLAFLNNTLSKRQRYLDDSLLYSVFNLSLIASIVGENEAFNIHLSGIRRIMQIRNQQTKATINSRLGFKINRLELSAYMSTGTLPPLPIGPLSWDSCYRDTDSRSNSLYSDAADLIPNHHLRTAFCDLKHLVNRVNQKYSSARHLTGFEFQSSVSSIQSRLLHLSVSTEDTESECMRLGMLAFMSTTLLVPGRRLANDYVATRLRRLCWETTFRGIGSGHMIIWLLLVGSISVFAADEPWIRAKWAEVAEEELTWEDLEPRLHDILWIDCIHREPAMKALSTIVGV